jgi:hypothetical protein
MKRPHATLFPGDWQNAKNEKLPLYRGSQNN